MTWSAALFLGLAIAIGADLAADMVSGASVFHLALESLVLILALAGVIGTCLELRAALRDGSEVPGKLEIARLDRARCSRPGRSRDPWRPREPVASRDP